MIHLFMCTDTKSARYRGKRNAQRVQIRSDLDWNKLSPNSALETEYQPDPLLSRLDLFILSMMTD